VHLALGKGLRRAAERAGVIGAGTVQVFVDNPTAWKRRNAPPKDLEHFRERLVELDVAPVAVHASYLVNLAGPDPVFRERSIDVLASDMAVAAGYGATLVNVHTGSHRDTTASAGIERVAEGVAAVLDRLEGVASKHQAASSGFSPGDSASAPVLALENAAGGGASIGATIEEHARIAELAATLGVPENRLSFCLDVAHAWGAGIGMDDPDEIDAWLAEFDRELGLRRLALIHLNDSRSERGSRTDRHEHVGAGRINPRGFRHLLTHPLLQEKPFVLETPGMDDGYDLINLDRAHALIAGDYLPTLPPEAFLFKRRSAASAPADDDVDLAATPPASRRKAVGARRR
jgi:deoxyribonuclease-4